MGIFKHPYIIKKINKIKQMFGIVCIKTWSFIQLFNKYALVVADFIYVILVIIVDFLCYQIKLLYIAAEPLIFHLLWLICQLLYLALWLLCCIWEVLKLYNRNFIVTGLPGNQIEDLIAVFFYLVVALAIILKLFF